MLVVDLFLAGAAQVGDRRASPASALLAALDPVLTLAVDGDDRVDVRRRATSSTTSRSCSRRCSCSSRYVVVLLSTDYIDEGDYYQGEYYFLLLHVVLGMVMMASARDLVTLFVALELLSIPAYMLAALAQARREVERGRRQVLPDRRVRHRP